MIENEKTLKTLMLLKLNNNSVDFAKDIAGLLREEKTPYLAYDKISVFGNPPSDTPEKIGSQDILVGTAVKTEPRGVVCANSAQVKINYFSEKGELAEKSDKIRKQRVSLLRLPMTGIVRVFSTISKHAPSLAAWLSDDTYTIERGVILEPDHKIKAPYKEDLLSESTLQRIKYFSMETYRNLFRALAKERKNYNRL